MTRGFSTYLNLLRFAAAMLVLLSHFAYARYSGGGLLWVRRLNLGSDAVILFFVLSGYVISYTAERKDHALGQFLFNRATRIYTVALPALLLGFACDRLGAALAPELYGDWWYNPLPLWELLLRGLSFSNEWYLWPQRLGTNGPYWSLSYEVSYYLLFAAAFYLRGASRAALIALGAGLAGLNILLLMPAWLCGVALYRRLSRGATVERAAALGYALLPVAAYVLALSLDVPKALEWVTETRLSFLAQAGLRFSDEFLWNGLIGLLVTVHLYGMSALLTGGALARFEAPIAWAAGGSFSIYLMHYPLLSLFSVLLPETGLRALNDLLLFGLTLLACLAFARVFERPLGRWRARLRGAIRRFTSARASAPDAAQAERSSAPAR
jgi:peptidoglycan/LPS O-acetylase OafA/YrhL